MLELSNNDSQQIIQQIAANPFNTAEISQSSINEDNKKERKAMNSAVKSPVHFEDEYEKSESPPSIDVEKRVTDAELIAILEQKIEHGNDEYALFQLGQVYLEMKQYEKAKESFELAVERHEDLQALFQLSVLHHDGLITSAEPTKAFHLMMSVAEQSAVNKEYSSLFYPAAFYIGLAYYIGDGVKINVDLAEHWWLRAAKNGSSKGSIEAQLSLGFHYSNKDHRDLKKAFFWFSEACGNGSVEAQAALGVMYFYGISVTRDLDAAFICLREASERGNIYAQGHLVFYYFIRKLFTKCTELGSKLTLVKDDESIDELVQSTFSFSLLVRKGLAIACFIMGRCLEKGKGVQINVEEAHHLYHRCFQLDPEVCAEMQQRVNMRQI